MKVYDTIENELLSDEFIKKASEYSDYDYDLLKQYIITSIEESKHTLKLINHYDLKDKRILEFGSGLGIASIVLSSHDYDVVSFEPGGLGFEKNILVNQFIKDYFELQYELISDISDIEENSFDFIFSNNVLEHIYNIKEVVMKLDISLKKSGIMIHNVPNYIVPYEPHFSILFCPIFPKRMSFLIPKRITDTNLWKSLNFINIFDVISYSKEAKATVAFEKELLYKTVNRIENDKEFRSRHIRLNKVINLLNKFGVIKLLKILPLSLNTPMVFEWKKNV